MAPVTLAESLALQAQVRDALSNAHLPISSLSFSSSPNTRSPSEDIPELLTRSLAERQSAQTTQPIVVPATYPGINPGANGGEVAGITIGVVFGVILVVWLISSLLNTNRTPVIETSSVTDGGYRRRTRTNKTRSSRHTRSRSVVSRSEMSEQQPPPRHPRSPRRARETVIIEETRREPSRPREVSRPRVVEDDDVIEVIEEHSPVRRPRRMSGYRNVDPDEYGGGGRPMRKVSSRR